MLRYNEDFNQNSNPFSKFSLVHAFKRPCRTCQTCFGSKIQRDRGPFKITKEEIGIMATDWFSSLLE